MCQVQKSEEYAAVKANASTLSSSFDYMRDSPDLDSVSSRT